MSLFRRRPAEPPGPTPFIAGVLHRIGEDYGGFDAAGSLAPDDPSSGIIEYELETDGGAGDLTLSCEYRLNESPLMRIENIHVLSRVAAGPCCARPSGGPTQAAPRREQLASLHPGAQARTLSSWPDSQSLASTRFGPRPGQRIDVHPFRRHEDRHQCLAVLTDHRASRAAEKDALTEQCQAATRGVFVA